MSPKALRHGGRGWYARGCRCEECVTAQRERQAAWRRTQGIILADSPCECTDCGKQFARPQDLGKHRRRVAEYGSCNLCRVSGCGKLRGKREGLCAMHYARLQRHGDLNYRTTAASALESYLKRIQPVESGCWEWSGARNDRGYGQITTGGKQYAHRFAYEFFVGPILDGLMIDHLCRNTACVNPDHLEPVTNAENVRRGITARTKEAA